MHEERLNAKDNVIAMHEERLKEKDAQLSYVKFLMFGFYSLMFICICKDILKKDIYFLDFKVDTCA